MAIAVVASTIFVVMGLFNLPYSFFMLLRIVLCIAAVIGVKRASEARQNNWVWVYAILAVLYNPVLPVHLGDKDVWVGVNVVTVVIFWVGLFKFENVSSYLRGLASKLGNTDNQSLQKVASQFGHRFQSRGIWEYCVLALRRVVVVCGICAVVFGVGYLVFATGLDKPLSIFFAAHQRILVVALVVLVFPAVNGWLKKHT